jgi:hypothetical protein
MIVQRWRFSAKRDDIAAEPSKNQRGRIPPCRSILPDEPILQALRPAPRPRQCRLCSIQATFLEFLAAAARTRIVAADAFEGIVLFSWSFGLIEPGITPRNA